MFSFIQEEAPLREADFMSGLSILASKYNCILVDVDFDTQTIELEGDNSDIKACLKEAHKIFYRYM